MKRLIFSLLLIAATSLLFTACKKEEEKNYETETATIVGKWQKANSNEYWRYNVDKTGDFWDEDEDVHEGEGTHFKWSVVGSQLRVTYIGQMGEEVPRDYEIKALTTTLMILKDVNYDTQTTYYKK